MIFFIYSLIVIIFALNMGVALFLTRFRFHILITTYTLLGCVLLAGIFLFLGNPTHNNIAVRTAYPNIKSGKLLFSHNDYGKGIYLLVDIGEAHPIYIQLPWNNKTAEKLEKMQRERSAKKAARMGEVPDIMVKDPLGIDLQDRIADFDMVDPPVLLQKPNPSQQNILQLD